MKTLIAIPCMDMMHTDFVRSLLGLVVEGQVQYTFAQASLIYDARNKLANVAIDQGFDRVLWLDSDVIFTSELFQALHADLDEGRDIVCAPYISRRRPIKPVIYKSCFFDEEQGQPRADAYDDYPAEALFEVAACGFGACMTSAKLLRDVRERFKLPFSPAMGFGEDLSFCMRAKELGVPIWCDSRVKVGHVGLCVYDEDGYRRERSEHVRE